MPAAEPRSFADLVARLRSHGEAPLAAWLFQSAHPIRFEPGRLELRLEPGVPADIVNRLIEALAKLTGRRWMVVLGSATGEPTLAQQAAATKEARLAEVRQDPDLQQILSAFPGAEIVDIRPKSG